MSKTIENPSKPATAGAIIFVDGDKGGVGKSWASCTLLDWMQKKQMPVAAVDGDTRNPDVSRMFADSAPVLNANLRIHNGWMDMIDFLVANPSANVVVSMPAGIGDVLKKEGRAFLQTAKLLNRPLGMLWVMNRQADSVNLLNEALAAIGDGLAFKVAVKNLMFGETDQFYRWEGSETKKRFEKSGGITIDMTELHERTVDKLLGNNDTVMPFSKAVMPVSNVSGSPHKLTPSENMELITWLQENHSAYETHVASLLA